MHFFSNYECNALSKLSRLPSPPLCSPSRSKASHEPPLILLLYPLMYTLSPPFHTHLFRAPRGHAITVLLPGVSSCRGALSHNQTPPQRHRHHAPSRPVLVKGNGVAASSVTSNNRVHRIAAVYKTTRSTCRPATISAPVVKSKPGSILFL